MQMLSLLAIFLIHPLFKSGRTAFYNWSVMFYEQEVLLNSKSQNIFWQSRLPYSLQRAIRALWQLLARKNVRMHVINVTKIYTLLFHRKMLQLLSLLMLEPSIQNSKNERKTQACRGDFTFLMLKQESL